MKYNWTSKQKTEITTLYILMMMMIKINIIFINIKNYDRIT